MHILQIKNVYRKFTNLIKRHGLPLLDPNSKNVYDRYLSDVDPEHKEKSFIAG